MKVLLLYSWEEGHNKARQWVTSMCYELSMYDSIDVSCDMFWNPISNVKKQVESHIKNADKIIVVVTESYNKKINSSTGIVSYEEKIYKDIISKEEDNNRILFLLKEKGIGKPKDWEDYVDIDVSQINEFEYFSLPDRDKKAIFDRIVRFCLDMPEYRTPSRSVDNNNNMAPAIKNAKSFEDLFKCIHKEKRTNKPSLVEQEAMLLDYLNTNKDDKSFAYDYLRSGLAADLNFSERMTPELFSEYFLVKRTDNEENRYNACLRDLFNSDSHNVLCLQSDGGSGKSVFIQSLAFRGKKAGRMYDYYNVLYDLSHLHENQMSKEDLVYKKLRKEYMRMSRENAEDKTYTEVWRKKFKDLLLALNRIDYEETILFKLNSFRTQLGNAILNLLPDGNNLDGWYEGYSKRLSRIKNAIFDKSILFIILLSVYLLVLLSKPFYNNPPRYILVFDNIETYDNGEEAKLIARYITGCHSFLTKLFTEIGQREAFFTKFTFVFVLRSSTFFRFSSLQNNILRGGTFNRKLKYLSPMIMMH